MPSIGQRMRQRAVFVSGQADQTFGMGLQFGDRGRGDCFFRRAQFCGGDQAAEILIAGASRSQQRVISAFGNADFRSDVRFDFALLGRHVKARRAIDSIAGRGEPWQAGRAQRQRR